VLELTRKVGRRSTSTSKKKKNDPGLVARGEVVLVEDKLGVTMTEIIQGGADN